jgi:hypothetical protein
MGQSEQSPEFPENVLFFFFLLGQNEIESTLTKATAVLLYQPRMMMDDDECRVIGGMFDRGNRSNHRKPAPVLSVCSILRRPDL